MIKKYTYLIIVIFTITTKQFAQQTVDNDKAHRRYWYYRTRLINDFMKIGKEQGSCIVLAQRNNDEDGLGNPELLSKIGPDQIDITNQYIMALALEYKLLSRNNQDTKETVKELYHLLYAINRLDLEAEQFFTSGMFPANDQITQNGQLNGFMLREDMPKQFFQTNKLHYNYALQERPTNSIIPVENFGGFTGVAHTNTLTPDNKFSDFFTGSEPLTDLTLVQDKYMSMLTAMMFVSKYIPTGVHYGNEVFQDGEGNIRQEAALIANRCYTYLKNKNNTWDLHYEDNNGNFLYPITAGRSAYLYSWPLSRMVCWVNSSFPWNQNNPFQCSNYSTPVSVNLGRVTYNGFTIGTTSCFEDNSVFKAWCQAGSNLSSLSNIGTLAPICLGMSANTSNNSIEWADLLRKVLHQDGALFKQLSVYGDAINTAPCQGPYNYGDCNHGGWEWSSQDRLEHPTSRGFGCNGNTPPHPVPCVLYTQNGGFQGNYPGVDYMLLHNLYYEYQNQLLDGNQGNVGADPSNILSFIYNAGTTVGNYVSSAACSFANAVSQVLTGNSNICDPTIGGSGNGGAGSNNVNIVGYPAYNLMDNRDENIWPRKANLAGPNSPGNIQGTNAIPARVSVFQNLTSIAHIYATSSPASPPNTTPSNVVYRAGKEIVLEPGFTVDQGSTFRAYIQRYLCNGGNNDPMTMRHLQDSTFNLSSAELDYETDMINPIPIHYIESPKSDADNTPVVPEEEYTDEIIADIATNNINTISFGITPNPTSGKVKVQTNKSKDDELFSIHVYDMKGQLIYIYENVISEFEFDLSTYSKGIYMIQVTSNLGNSTTKKIDLID